MKQVQTQYVRGKLLRDFNDIKVKSLRQFCTYPKVNGAVLYIL